MSSGTEKESAPGASVGILSGKTVFVAASAKLLSELTAGLKALGAETLPIAVLEAKEIEDYAALDLAIANISQYDWIIFTSAWGVSFFAKRLSNRQPSPSQDGAEAANILPFCLPEICAIGPATARAAENQGFSVRLTADEFTAEGVMQALQQYRGGVKNLRGLNILIPRALQAREFLPAALASAGCRVDAIPCYQTVRPEPSCEVSARLRNETPNLLVFTSAKALQNFLKTEAAVVGAQAARRRLHETATAVIGPVTAAALLAEGKSAEIIPAESTVPALLVAITEYFQFVIRNS